MVHIEKITSKNVWDIVKLKVREDQKDFVAPNDLSLVEAYLALDGGARPFPFGIYDDERAVGFLMIGYGVEEQWTNPPRIAQDNYCLWRLMIDEVEQHKGYGKKAMELAIEFVKTFPMGEAKEFWLSYEPENLVAKEFYNKMGFVENGETDGEEIIAVMQL